MGTSIGGWWAIALLAGGLVLVPAAVGHAQQGFTGITEAVQNLLLSLPVAGRIDGVMVKEGDRVSKGKVILHLDKALEELELERRTLALNDRSGLEAARRREEVLRSQVEDLRRLASTNSVARKQKEDGELALMAAVAERQALEVAERRERIELQLAKEALDRRFLRAPVDGVVVRLNRRAGESINALEPVVRLVDASRCRFVGNVEASVGPRLRVGDSVIVRIGAETGGILRPAQMVFVSPVADPASGLVEVKAEFDNGDGAIRPGVAGMILLPENELSSDR